MKSPYTDSLSHTTWECKYHIVFALKSILCSAIISGAVVAYRKGYKDGSRYMIDLC